jgi:CheY-like chemotaxis protein
MIPHVLMVDDNPGDLQLIEEAFKDMRIPVAFIAATEAGSALGYLARAAVGEERRPDVLILDFKLPGMDGREVVAALRDDPTWKELPVVVLSGAEFPTADLPVDEVVAKPDSYARYCALAQRLQRYWAPRRSGRVATAASAGS